MKRAVLRVVGMVFCMMATGVPAAPAAEKTPGLDLEPCTVELVDGTKIDGKLAVQFQMPEHLVVYSPRLATVRSFRKDHVHALTIAGERKELNPKRALTEEDRKLLGRVRWPDEPPAEGRQPPYTTETWNKPKQLLVWARPGKSGRFDDTSNWLVNGAPVRTLATTEVWSGPAWHRGRGVSALNKDTDLLIPVAASAYQVRGRGDYLARHITVESGAAFHHGLKGAYGNLWVDEHGRIDGGGHASLLGGKHTFFVNGERRDPAKPVDWSTIEAKHFARKWVVRKDARDASVELIGSIGSGDETHVIRGRAVVSENTTVLIGPRCCQSVRREATLQLTSGAVVAKNSNQLHKQDMMVVGTLLAGTPDRPLESDCYIGISFKDHAAAFAGRMWSEVGRRVGFRGFEVVPTGTIRVHSADPTEARLVFCCHRQDGCGDTGSLPSKEQDPKKWAAYEKLPRRINLVFWEGADVQLDGVEFRDIEKGGIRLQDLNMKDPWKHVYYGENNAGPPEQLLVQYEPTMEGRGAYSFPIEKAAKGDLFTAHGLYTINPGTPIIETPDGCYPKGKTVKVRLSSEINELEVRYTLDGAEPSASSTLYLAPFTVSEDVVVKAAGFKDGKRLGDTAEARFRFVAADEVKLTEGADPGKTSAGLAYKVFDGEWETMPDFRGLKPVNTGVVPVPDLDALERGRDKSAVVFEGYLAIEAPGPYNVYLGTAKADACRVYVNGRRIIDNDMDTYESVGLAGLAKGKHALRIEFMDGGWGELVRMALRKLDDPEKRAVTPNMLSH